MKALHLYCVVGNEKALEFDLADVTAIGSQVSAIRHHQVAALVGPAPARPYRLMKREEVLRHLVTHQAVIEQVMRRHTVVPVKFGTTARDRAQVQKILERGDGVLMEALQAMEGKIEFDLVAQWRNLRSVFRQIGDEPEIKAHTAAIARRPGQDTTEERVKIGAMVKARLDRIREERAREIVETLKPLVRDSRPHALFDDHMIVNTAVLVDRAREPEFGETLERLNAPYRDAIDFRCVGPLPPYSFATVEITTFQVETVNRARRLLRLGEDAGAAERRGAYRRLAQQCHPDHAIGQAGMAGWGAAVPFAALTEAYRLLEAYGQIGSSLRPQAVEAAVAVRLLRWPQEPGGA